MIPHRSARATSQLIAAAVKNAISRRCKAASRKGGRRTAGLGLLGLRAEPHASLGDVLWRRRTLITVVPVTLLLVAMAACGFSTPFWVGIPPGAELIIDGQAKAHRSTSTRQPYVHFYDT